MTYPGDHQGGYPPAPQNWGYPQQPQPAPGYPAHGGFPPPPPPKKRTNLVVALSVVALVAIVGAVVTIVLVNRQDEGGQAQPAPVTSSSTRQAPTTTRGRTTAPTTKGSDPLTPQNDGWTVIRNERARLLYEVPPTWTPIPDGSLRSTTMSDVTIYSPATLTDYQCEGQGYSRGGLGAGTVPKAEAATAATTLAKGFGAEFYASSGAPQVQTTEPKDVTVKTLEGKQVTGVQVDGVVTTTGSNCLASKGKVSILVLEASSNLQFLMVNGDLAGGPASPAPPSEDELQKILLSTRAY